MLHTDQGKSFSCKMIEEMCRLLGIGKNQTSLYKLERTGQTDGHNTKVADNPNTWDTALSYLNFLYNTTINRKTGATPFSMVHGEESQYLVYLFYAKPPDEVMMKDGFAEWLDEQFRDAHSSAGETLGTDQRGRTIPGRKFTQNPMRVVTRSGCGHKRRLSQRSLLTCGTISCDSQNVRSQVQVVTGVQSE